jgi:hypothetical protein
MRQRQQGMTFIGLLCILVLVGIVGYAGVRLVPLEMTASEAKGDPDPGRMRNILERHWEIEDPTEVDYKDIEITKDDTGVQMHVAYDDSAPYFANVSLKVHFEKTVKVE